MNSRILVGIAVMALGAAAFAPVASAGHRGYDRARVVQVEPLFERVRYTVPVEQCWDEERVRGGYRAGDPGAAIIGGAVGAVVGHTIARGDSRPIATLGGALVGAVLANEASRAHGYREVRTEIVRRCEVRHEERFEERIAAYRVTYVYNGRREFTRLSYDPGRYLEVSVDVRPRH